MKKTVTFLLSAFLLFSSIYGITQEFPKSQITATKNIISAFSYENKSVRKVSSLFINHLQQEQEINEKDFVRILKAMEFAAQRHKDQKRLNEEKTPYIIHPIGVAYNLLTIGKVRDPDILIGALLHDTVEDTNTTFEEIESIFGKQIESLVREVTDDKSLPKLERKRLQIIGAPNKSAGATQIKLADNLYNLNDLLYSPPANWEKSRFESYVNFIEQVVSALPGVNLALKEAVEQKIAAYRAR